MFKIVNFKALYTLLPVLSICVWTIGCGQPSSNASPDTSTDADTFSSDEAGSTTGAGTETPGDDTSAEGESTDSDGTTEKEEE